MGVINPNPLTPAIRRMLDVSTSHITQGDIALMGNRPNDGPIPRTLGHTYGGVAFVGGNDLESMRDAVQAMRDRGYSESFVMVYIYAADLGDVILLNSDADADVMEGLPTHNW